MTAIVCSCWFTVSA